MGDLELEGIGRDSPGVKNATSTNNKTCQFSLRYDIVAFV